MDTFEVEYHDNHSLQFSETIEGSSHRNAAQKSVQNDKRIGATEEDSFRLRVYPTGSPEKDKLFKYTELK